MKNKSPIFSFFLIALMAAFNSSVFSQCTSPLTPLDLSASAATNTTRLNCILLDAISTANGNNDVYVTIPNSLKVGTIYPNETYAINQININNSVWPGSSTHTLFITIEPGVTLETPYTSFYLLINPQIHFQNESACDISQSRMQHTINTVNSSIKVKNKLSNETLAIKVYPNPSPGELQINFADNTIKSQVEVYNSMGMKLLSFNNVNNKTTINLEHLVTGNYILKIISKNSICFKKIAIIK